MSLVVEPQYPCVLMGIDSGVREIGIACWTLLGEHDTPPVPSTANIVQTDCDDWADGVRQISGMVMKIMANAVKSSLPLYVGIEMPEAMNTARAHAARQDVMRVAYGAGTCAAATWTCGGISIEVRPSQWKGTLSKREVTRRLRGAIGGQSLDCIPLSSHMWDAVGIGMWVMGFPMTHPAFST